MAATKNARGVVESSALPVFTRKRSAFDQRGDACRSMSTAAAPVGPGSGIFPLTHRDIRGTARDAEAHRLPAFVKFGRTGCDQTPPFGPERPARSLLRLFSPHFERKGESHETRCQAARGRAGCERLDPCIGGLPLFVCERTNRGGLQVALGTAAGVRTSRLHRQIAAADPGQPVQRCGQHNEAMPRNASAESANRKLRVEDGLPLAAFEVAECPYRRCSDARIASAFMRPGLRRRLH